MERNREHLLEEILLIAIAAVLSGAESWNDIADYGLNKREWLKTFLRLPGGIPSHDTFNRVFAALDPEEMERGFATWVSSIARLTAGEVVTIDAMGCQREIAQRIIDKKADYVLAVKDNQGLLAEQVRDSFLLQPSDAVAEEIDCGHGRVEQRKCSVIADLSMIEKAAEWASLQGLVRIESERYHKVSGKIEREIRYYITSLRPDAARLNAVIRQHWGIENKLHWVLDVGFGEDLDRKRTGHAAQNFSLLNRIALNLLRRETTFKRGIIGKRLKAAWNHPYLLKLLGI
ncbi:MAG: ISAs1 family transposase [Terracidiphilus sp.]